MVKIYICYIWSLREWYARIETDLTQGIRYKYKPTEQEIKDDFSVKEARIIWQD